MALTHFLILLAGGCVVILAAYVYLSLLKSSQAQEDAEDERVWQYLLR
ncbi:MAG: hypothetical protein WBQ89_01460 [Candidatus Acidiferrum sp.]